VGAIIMVHGDDQGLVLPPRLAPHQAVLVPIYKNDQERSLVMEQVETTRQALEGNRIRLRIDDRQEVTPGFKFNDWEMRGVPVRIEIGPKDVSRGTVTLARRDQRSRQSVNQGSVAEAMDGLLADIQRSMLERAREFQRQNTHQPEDYDGLKEAVQSGWAEVWWCGDPADEIRIQQDTKATNRVILLDQKAGEGRCIVCGKAARERAIFARAY
jgi:prolyl-tRNA synthetase